MYHHFNGILTNLELSFAVVECGGVGYKLLVSGSTHREISPRIGERVSLLAHLTVREDAMELYGFSSEEELEAFKLLLTVSGVGPKAATAILTALTPDGLAAAISRQDTRAISMAQGVGGKTAARVVLELHDKFAALPVEKIGATTPSGGKPSASLGDALDGLMTLGYTRAEATAVLRQVKTESRDTGEIIKDALKLLMKK